MKTRILEDCLRIARRKLTSHPEFRIGYLHYSFIIFDGQIVAWATNKKANQEIFRGYSKISKLHAEVAAYRRASRIRPIKGFSIVNIRLNSFGDLRNSEPCECCLNWLKILGCREIWFSTNLGMTKKRKL